MSIGSDFAKSITGNVETAILVIHDYRELMGDLKSHEKNKLDTEKALNALKLASTKQALQTGQPPSYIGSKERILKVQFNPSRLTLNGSVFPQYKSDAASEKARALAAEDMKLTMSVSLIFDDMDTYDAFMWEKFTSGLTTKGVSNLVKSGMTLAGKGKVHSVQPYVESLVSALRNPYTRLISFRWADFVFTGQLHSVQANYTMFSTSGRPIRAEVHMRIRHEMDPNLMEIWYKKFEKAFGNDTSNLMKPEQNLSNLLNLNL